MEAQACVLPSDKNIKLLAKLEEKVCDRFYEDRPAKI